MRRAKSSLGFVDRGEEVFEFLAEVRRSELSNAFEVSLGSIGHDRQLGGDRRQVLSGHESTIDPVTRTRLQQVRR